MREIKFRGRKPNGEWIYGDYHKRAGGVHCIIKMEPDENGKVVYVVHQAVPDTIGQFTGMHDKNGKDIYEGDIIESDGYSGARHYVGYRKEEAMFVAYIIGTTPQDYCGVFQRWIDDYEKMVIGNIHDNPELLNK